MGTRITEKDHVHRWKLVSKFKCDKCKHVWRKKWKCRDCPETKNWFDHCEHSL